MVKLKNVMKSRILRGLLGMLLSAAGGYIFSGTSISGISSFADISLAGSLGLPCAAAVMVGAIIRCVTTGSVGKSIVKLAAISMIVTAKLFSERFSRPAGCGIITAAAVVMSGCGVSSLIGEMPEKLLFYALYGIIAGAAAYSGARAVETLSEEKVIDLTGANGCVYGVVCVVYMASLSSVRLPFAYPGIAAGALLTLGGAFFYGTPGGLICGALSATGAFLSDTTTGTLAAMLPAAGLLTGLLGRRRILLSAAFFALSCFMLTVLGGSPGSVELTFSVVLGCAFFVIAAPYFSDKWVRAGDASGSGHPDISGVRTSFLSDAVEAVRLDYGRISAALSAAGQSVISADRAKKVCSRCYRRSVCAVDSETSAELIPVLPEDCIRKRELAEELEYDLRSRAADRVMRLRFAEERELLDEHIRIAGELIRSLGKEPDLRYSGAVSGRIAEKLRTHGIEPEAVIAGYNHANRLLIELYFGLDSIPESTGRIRDLIADDMELDLCTGTAVTSARETRVTLYERPEYEIEVCSASKSADGGISGDSWAMFTDGSGRSCVVLSDGMGSGRTAAVDSHIVIGMLRRLLCSGMEPGTAVKLINSVMATKSRNESFATLDAVIFDPDECRMISVKSGAAATILRRGSDVIRISAATFPVGIVKEAELSVSEYDLGAGDMAVMFSDGIPEGASLFIKELLTGDAEPEEIVKSIAEKGSVFAVTDHPDDVTVLCIRVRHSGERI